MTTLGKQLVESSAFADFLQMQSEHNYELIYGEVVQKMPTELHGKLAALIAHFLLAYILPRQIKAHVGVEVRYQMPDDRLNSRLPDVSLRFSDDPAQTDGVVTTLPDLAVEIQSPTDDPRHLREKAGYYLRWGTHLVWLVYPQQQSIEICTLDAGGHLTIETHTEGVLGGGDVLPDFALPLATLFSSD